MRQLRSSLRRLDLFEQEYQRQAGQAKNSEQPEILHKSPETALSQELIVNAAQSLALRQNRTRLGNQRGPGSTESLDERRVEGRQVRNHDCLMDLRPTHQQRAHQGDAETAAEVAHQVKNPGGIPDLFGAQMAHGRGGEGNENETDRHSVEHARKDHIPHGNIEIDVPQPKGGGRQKTEPDRDQNTVFHFPNNPPDDRGSDERSYPARTKRESCLAGRVT